MPESIDQIIDQLPMGGLTVRALQALDYIVPGSWQNLTGFDNSIRQITGESDPEMIGRIRARSLDLFNDSSPRRRPWRNAGSYRLLRRQARSAGRAA